MLRLSPSPDDWIAHGKVRAREAAGGLEITIDGLTTQAAYYKPLVREFVRKTWRGGRPAFGDFSVEILMEFTGDPPHMDLDNLAKAMLDSAGGAAFHDDSQIARLLVERRNADREGVWMLLSPM